MRKEQRRKLHSSGIQASLNPWHGPENEAERNRWEKNEREAGDVLQEQVEASRKKGRKKERVVKGG